MKIVIGDLIDAAKNRQVTAIAHQCNCQGVMGAGIAKSVKINFPEAYIKYINDNKRLSRYSCFDYGDLMVINLYGQDRYGIDYRHTNYAALTLSIIRCIADHKLKSLALPYMIGCGLAGGSWFVVEDILEDIEIMTGCEIILYKMSDDND